MTTSSPSELRRNQIASARVDASRLMAAANHDTMKQQVRLAERDLTEAEMWLQHDNIDVRPYVLAIVDMLIRLASARLQAVNMGLQTYGPDAMLIGG